MRLLVTGGAGFVGSNLCVGLAIAHPDWEIIALDNLRRRGSELALARLREFGVMFRHGDVRVPGDLESVGHFDAMIECSAEPSVMAGFSESAYSVETNLIGAYNCLEASKKQGAFFVFLSTSRVYPVAPLLDLKYVESPTRFELTADQPVPGAGREGIAESFPMDGARTLYGATKLSAEHLIEEFRDSLDLSAVINRCGVIAGPWQMGKVDQGVFSWWLLSHLFDHPLSYIGHGGTGKQVRDLLHIDDLVDLIEIQLTTPQDWDGTTVNVGGGVDHSLSLLETTRICREITGRVVEIESVLEDRPGDVPIYISDCSRLNSTTTWRPKRDPKQVLTDLLEWASAHEDELRSTLGFQKA